VLNRRLLSEECSFASTRELAEHTAAKIIGDCYKRSERLGIRATSQVLFDDPVHGIAMLAASENVGMIVMGTHARTGIARALKPSIAETILRQTTTPLCIVRKQAIGERHRRMLVPVIKDDLSTFAIEYATEAALSLGSRLLFCTVDSSPSTQTKQYLESAKTHAMHAGVQSEWIIVPHNRRTSACILHQVRVEECDAIVMASHGRAGLSRLMQGSVAEAVIRSSDVPVVVLREAR
jgi:nucleotide-binding universal stress UspA family protein